MVRKKNMAKETRPLSTKSGVRVGAGGLAGRQSKHQRLVLLSPRWADPEHNRGGLHGWLCCGLLAKQVMRPDQTERIRKKTFARRTEKPHCT